MNFVAETRYRIIFPLALPTITIMKAAILILALVAGFLQLGSPEVNVKQLYEYTKASNNFFNY
jgi:hypothetical protein